VRGAARKHTTHCAGVADAGGTRIVRRVSDGAKTRHANTAEWKSVRGETIEQARAARALQGVLTAATRTVG